MEHTTKTQTTTSTDTMVISRAEYIKLVKELTDFKKQLEETQKQWATDKLIYEERIRLLKRKLFGSSSEKTKAIQADGLQASLFDEAELIASIEEMDQAEEETEIKVESHTRRKRGQCMLEDLPEEIPTEVVEHTLSEEERRCPECGSERAIIGKVTKKTLVIKPRQVWIREDVYYTMACKNCEETTGTGSVEKTPREQVVLPGSFASPEAIAYLMYEKFCLMSPLYRMEQDFKREGIPLSRQTMSNWVLQATAKYLQPVYELLHKQLLQEDILHADETTLQVLQESDGTPQSKRYMWLYRTGKWADNPIVLYEYCRGRGQEYPEKFLEGYRGYLHCDGYQVYRNLDPEIIPVGCWIHLRRKFDEAMKAQPKGKSPTKSLAQRGLSYCSQLLNLDKKLDTHSVATRYKERLDEQTAIIDDLFAWANTVMVPPKSSLGKALTYLRNQEASLRNYLKDGRLEMTNNLAERSIKPFVMGRKNFLFAITPRGAQGSAIMYSIIETAKARQLDPYRYLCYIFREGPKLDRSTKHWAEALLPENAPEECSTRKKKKA